MRELARELGAWLLLGSLVIDPAGEPGAARRGAPRQPLVPDRRGGRDRRALRQDPHVRHRSADGESYRESNAYRPGDRRSLAETPWGRLGMTRVLRRALPPSLSRAGPGRRRFPSRAVGLHGADRAGALACAAAGAGDRDRLLRVRAGAMGRACRRPQDLWPLADRRSLGRGAGRGGEATGIITAKIDPAPVAEARRSVPSLKHDRAFAPPALASRPLAAE